MRDQVAKHSLTVGDPPTQGGLPAVVEKMNELINALRRYKSPIKT
ncbi:MAG: hypothetical protein NTY01_25530 [Verrucomicrobia bacterium]|nr:hypothetical protein [Verrucomicrobiota bacterium]